MTEAADRTGLTREQEQITRSTTRIMGGAEMDQEARDLGHQALSRLDTHENVCTERWTQSRAAIASVQATLDIMNRNMLGRVPAGVIAALMGLVGWLSARAFPIH